MPLLYPSTIIFGGNSKCNPAHPNFNGNGIWREAVILLSTEQKILLLTLWRSFKICIYVLISLMLSVLYSLYVGLAYICPISLTYTPDRIHQVLPLVPSPTPLCFLLSLSPFHSHAMCTHRFLGLWRILRHERKLGICSSASDLHLLT